MFDFKLLVKDLEVAQAQLKKNPQETSELLSHVISELKLKLINPSEELSTLLFCGHPQTALVRLGNTSWCGICEVKNEEIT